MRGSLWLGIAVATAVVSLIAHFNDYGAWFLLGSAVSGFLLAVYFSEGKVDTGRFWMDGAIGALMVGGLSIVVVAVVVTGFSMVDALVTGTP